VPSNTPVTSLVQNVQSLTNPVLNESKESIITGAPWALRLPLRMAWPWVMSTLLPLVIRLVIETLLGRYGPAIATLLAMALPSLQKLLSPEVYRWAELILEASQTQLSEMSQAVQMHVTPLALNGSAQKPDSLEPVDSDRWKI